MNDKELHELLKECSAWERELKNTENTVKLNLMQKIRLYLGRLLDKSQ